MQVTALTEEVIAKTKDSCKIKENKFSMMKMKRRDLLILATFALI